MERLKAALRLKPDSAEAHLNLGMALAGDPARLSAAIAEYEAALRLGPDSAEGSQLTWAAQCPR